MPGSWIKICIVCLLVLTGCHSGNQKFLSSKKGILMPLSYAKGFRIEKFPAYRKITIYSPWQKAEGVTMEYYLVSGKDSIPPELAGKQLIRTPLERIICLSTSHIGFLSALNETATLKGLSGAGLVSDSSVKKAVRQNLIKDVGYDQGLNYEVILSLKPNLIMAYGVGGEITGILHKLKDLNQNVLLNGEYLEETPLAKAEWIKLVGALYNKEEEAAEYFSTVEKNYLEIKQKVKKVNYRPTVLTGFPYKDSWWMAGGHSNLAHLIADSGGEFLWKEDTSREAFVVSIEQVIARAVKADFWINCSTVNSIPELIAVDERFAGFPQVRKKTIYNNNFAVNKSGGNDYWEKGVVRPDLILADLVRIFHPEIDSSQSFVFYKKIE